MTNYVGLDVSQKTTTLCIVDGEGHRQWRGECVTSPEHIAQAVLQHAGAKASIGIETGPMTPWLVHKLRSRGLDVIRHEGNPVVRAHGAHEHQPLRAAPHEPFAEVASNIEVCRRVEPQQLHEFLTALEKPSRTARSRI